MLKFDSASENPIVETIQKHILLTTNPKTISLFQTYTFLYDLSHINLHFIFLIFKYTEKKIKINIPCLIFTNQSYFLCILYVCLYILTVALFLHYLRIISIFLFFFVTIFKGNFYLNEIFNEKRFSSVRFF